MEKEKIYVQHEENKKWMNDLLFYLDEIKIMNHRLEEFSVKNADKNALASLEHFQNQLIVQKNNIDELKHKINLSNDTINKEIKNNINSVDHRSITDHKDVRENVESLAKVFESLKSEMKNFLIK